MLSLRLYQLAMRFALCEPWKGLTGEQFFAVRFPDGRTGYCSIFGGRNPGMALYMGDESLLGLEARLSSPPDLEDWQRHRLDMEQRCAEFRLAQWPDLQSFGQEEVLFDQRLAKKGEWIPECFERRPFKAPGPLSPEQDGDLCLGLEAALWLNERLYEGALTPKAAGFCPEKGLCPLILPGERGEWLSRPFPQPNFEALRYPSPRISDEVGVARLRRMKQNRASSLVCELMAMPEPVSGTPPRYPAGMIIVDMTDGGVAAIPIVEDLEEQAEGLVAALLSVMQSRGRPARVVARDRRTLDLISTALGQIGCPVERAREVHGMDQLRRELYREVFQHAQKRMREREERLAAEGMGENKLLKGFSEAKAGSGRCALCGGRYAKGGLISHLRACGKQKIPGGAPYLMIRAEDMRFKQYFLFFAVSVQANLAEVDRLLRAVWAEGTRTAGRFFLEMEQEACEGERLERPMERILQPGGTLRYECGGAKIRLSVIERFSAMELGRMKLMARNLEPRYQCARCSARARFVSDQGELLCPQCAGTHDREVRPLKNAPQDARQNADG